MHQQRREGRSQRALCLAPPPVFPSLARTLFHTQDAAHIVEEIALLKTRTSGCLALKAGVGDERGVGECGSRRGRERGAPLTRIRTVR